MEPKKFKGISDMHSYSYSYSYKHTDQLTQTLFNVLTTQLENLATQTELEIIDAIDVQVDAMTEFPEALALIKSATKL
jgi:hypothetical protein